MFPPRFVRRSLLFVLCLSTLVAGMLLPASPAAEYQPMLGQPGKDVQWLPTCQVLVDTMLDMADVKPEDYVMDLGSGDGRLVITAAKRGARALGVEYNENLVALSKNNAAREGVSDRALFVNADLFETDLREATIITMFLMPEINMELRPRILALKPGTRIVSNTFTMGDWTADRIIVLEDRKECYYFTALLWLVPAKVEGTWKLPRGELRLKQEYQVLSGTFKAGKRIVPVTDGRLRGDLISFRAGNERYEGRVTEAAMEGTCKSGKKNTSWKATRTRSRD